ncbi:MAG: 30S ribosomal protein S12 methylthiotransferase RimO [Arenicellales bacterium WSBS_2016_MAG_OTU3]
MATINTVPKVGFVSLGCPKATWDSERILTQLRAEGYAISSSYAESDLVIINTCGFIDAAVTESLDAIAEAQAENGRVIVTGCLGASKEKIQERFDDLLAITGPQATEEVLQAVHQHLPPVHDPFVSLLPPGGIKLTPRHYAYLKIAEGCNHRCRFCIIPSMRGDLVSRPVGDVMAEAEALISAGVKELLIVSQDTSAYGVDVKYKTEFYGGRPIKTNMLELTRALGSLGVWVRLHYVYPYPHVDNVIPLMEQGTVLPYLDVPMQHASNTILKSMRRPASSENNLKRIQGWREMCSDITIRSTFIVGFPGETDADFEELLEFLQAAQLDRVGCFAYSPVEGATANELPDHVDEELKQERLERFMQTQAVISAAKLQAKIGRTIQVLVDDVAQDGTVIARSKADAPEIDGLVFVQDAPEVQPGQLLDVEVNDADEHDLYATLTA